MRRPEVLSFSSEPPPRKATFGSVSGGASSVVSYVLQPRPTYSEALQALQQPTRTYSPSKSSKLIQPSELPRDGAEDSASQTITTIGVGSCKAP